MGRSLTELKNKNNRLYTKIKDIDTEIQVIRGLLYTSEELTKAADTDIKKCIIDCVKKRNKLVLQHNKITFILSMLEYDIIWR